MSLINQVLNDLERRGARPGAGQDEVRAVPAASASFVSSRLPWLAGLVGIGLLLTALVLWLARAPASVPVEQVIAASTVPQVASAPMPEVVSEVVATVAWQPASKLSFELSQIPTEAPTNTTRPGSAKPSVRTSSTAPAETSSAPQAVPMVEPPRTAPLKQISATQKADAEYRKALAAQRQGQTAQALAGFAAALELLPTHQPARLAQAALLVENRRFADAERTLQEGLQRDAADLTLTMALARAQVEQGDTARALTTLEGSLARAEGKADYHAFYAALLQRLERHQEAVTHYQIALQLAPSSGVWWMGYGISLQALARVTDARDAYQQALATHTLNPQLTAFVEQKLKGF